MTAPSERKPRGKPHLVSVRLTDEMHDRLVRAQQQGAYVLSKAVIIERGIVLAIEELAASRAALSSSDSKR